jgi:valyl-tRNA synthetase
LPRPSVIDLDARLAGPLVPEPLRGLERFEAREAAVAMLRAEGTLLAEEAYTIPIGLSQRTKAPVEPILSLQWFYDTDAIAERVLEGLDAGDIALHPERYTKVNRDWLEKLRHWNISRQLWWGHRIPAWYDDEGNVYVPDPERPDLDPPDDPRYAGVVLRQDPDVFDTWFSSNLWPFSTLGWPDESDPFYRFFYPTSVLVTGYDILFFWVARMQMAGYQLTGQRPFEHVLLHGLVLDEEGQKMSKSKGNGIDPLTVIEAYGADALRFATTLASTGGQDIRWDPRRVEMGRNFTTKLWNAARFAFMNLDGPLDPGPPQRLADRWIVSRLQRVAREVSGQLDAFDLGLATRTLYDFVWSEFCDWYLEAAKPALREGDPRSRHTLQTTLETILGLLHPFIPFVTSELHQALAGGEQLGWRPWPEPDDALLDEGAERDFAMLMEAVAAARTLRSEANLAPAQTIRVHGSGEGAALLSGNAEVFAALARAELLAEAPAGAALTQPLPGLELKLPFAGLIDVDEWRQRQHKRLMELHAERAKSESKLANERFVSNAPEAVVAEERRRLEQAEELIRGVEASLAKLA